MLGPFTYSSNKGPLYISKTWYTQKRPYKAPLPYTYVRVDIRAETPVGHTAAGKGYFPEDLKALALSSAYDKLKGKISETAENAVNLIQWRQAAAGINEKAELLLRLVRAVKRASPREIKRVLNDIGVHGGFDKKALRDQSKSFSDRWLEYSFGWKPLIDDIYRSVDILQLPQPPSRVVSRTTKRRTGLRSGSWTSNGVTVSSAIVRCQLKAEIAVSNPNLYVANNLGLVDPVKVVWELVPWSFVVDWFTNLGQVLGTMSDFAGLSINNAATTYYTTADVEYFFGFVPNRIDDYWVSDSVEVVRRLGIQKPTLLVRPFTGFSVTRGANALALAIQQLVRQ